jgi:hypothetical protein
MNMVDVAATITVSIRVDIGWRTKSAAFKGKRPGDIHREAVLEL